MCSTYLFYVRNCCFVFARLDKTVGCFSNYKLHSHDELFSNSQLLSLSMNFRENSFVKIVGQLREYEGRKHVLIYDIAPVTDWNELTHHLLQIVYVHLQNTKGPIPVRLNKTFKFVL